jgi:hypothetical protein
MELLITQFSVTFSYFLPLRSIRMTKGKKPNYPEWPKLRSDLYSHDTLGTTTEALYSSLNLSKGMNARIC